MTFVFASNKYCWDVDFYFIDLFYFLGIRWRHCWAGHLERGQLQGFYADHAVAAWQPDPLDVGRCRRERRRWWCWWRKLKWIHEKILLLKKSIPVANVCTIVTTTRSKKREKKWELFQNVRKIQKKIFSKTYQNSRIFNLIFFNYSN